MLDTVGAVLAPKAAMPPCDKRIGELYRYWLSRWPAPDLLPGRQHCSPSDIPDLLPWVWLADVHRNPLRLKYRLVGTACVEATGSETTGRWLDEVHPDFRASALHSHFEAVAERAQVSHYRGRPLYISAIYEARKWKTLERLILPLARDGLNVDMLFCLTTFEK